MHRHQPHSVPLLAASVCRGGRIGVVRGAAGAGHHTGRWRVHQRFAAVAVAGWIVLPAVRNREIRRGAVYGDDADLPRRAHPPSLHGHCAGAGRAGGRIPADSGAAEPVHRGVNPHRQPDSHHYGGREVAAYSADAHRRAGRGHILRMVGAISAAAPSVLPQSLFHDER